MAFIETHCHLDMLKKHSVDEAITLAKNEGVEKIVTIATHFDNYQTVIDLTDSYPQVYGTLGTHPHEAKEWQNEHLDFIKKNILNSPKIKAIGEIGLDYHYTRSPVNDQVRAFEAQLQLACELELPVVIHTREAESDTLRILKNFSSSLTKKGVLHSYTSNSELASWALSEGFYLGFNGIITFKKAENVREIVALAPSEQIVFETDSPFLAPTPHRGKENGPFHLPLVAQKIAEIKHLSADKLFTTVYNNSNQLFNF